LSYGAVSDNIANGLTIINTESPQQSHWSCVDGGNLP